MTEKIVHEEDLRHILASMLLAIWRGIDPTLKSRYRMTIWTQFEENIRAAAYTSSLSKFLNSFCFKMAAVPGRNAEDRKVIAEAMAAVDERRALRMLRDETTYLVLKVRLAQQERRQAYQQKEAETEGGLFDGDAELSI